MQSRPSVDQEHVLYTTGLATIDVNASGQITNASIEATELTGYEHSELIGMSVESLVPISARHKHAGYRESFSHDPRSRNMTTEGDLTLRPKYGDTLPVTISLHAKDNTGGVRCVIKPLQVGVRRLLSEDIRSIIVRLGHFDSKVDDLDQCVDWTVKALSSTFSDRLTVFWKYNHSASTYQSESIYEGGQPQPTSQHSDQTSSNSQIGFTFATLGNSYIANEVGGEDLELPPDLVKKGFTGGITSIVAGRFEPEGVLAVYFKKTGDALDSNVLDYVRQVADALSFSISRQRAEIELRAELDLQNQLSRAVEEVASSRDLSSCFENVSNILKEIVHHDRLVVATVENDGSTVQDYLVAGSAVGNEPPVVVDMDSSSYLDLLVRQAEPYILVHGNLDKSSAAGKREQARLNIGLRSMISVPVMGDSKVQAILTFWSKADGAYGQAELSLASRIAELLSGPVISSVLKAKIESDRTIQSGLSRIAAVANESLDKGELHDRFAESLQDMLSYDRLVIADRAVRSDGTRLDTISYVRGVEVEDRAVGQVLVALEDQDRDRSASQRDFPPLFASDSDQAVHKLMKSAGLKSGLRVIVSHAEQEIAVIAIRSISDDFYGTGDMELLCEISERIAPALANARQHETVLRLSAEREALADIGRNASKSLDPNEFYVRVADSLATVISFDRLSISEFRSDTSTVVIESGVEVPEARKGSHYKSDLYLDPILNGKTIVMDKNLKPIERSMVKAGLNSRIQLFLGEPENPLGTLVLSRRSRNGFTQSEEILLRRIANEISHAMANAFEHRQVLDLMEKVAEGEARYRELFDSAPDMILSADVHTGAIVDNNRTTELTLGYTAHELKNLRIFDLYHPNYLETAEKVFRRFQDTGEVSDVRALWIRKDGSVLEVSINVTAILDGAGKIIRSISTVRDESDHVEAERVLEFAQRIDSDNRELVRLNEMRSEFLSRVSHELRTPLTALLAFTSILSKNREGTLTSRQKKQLGLVQDNGWKLEDLIGDLLDVAKSEAGELRVEKSPFDVVALAKQVVDSERSIFDLKQQHISLILDTKSAWVNGDEKRVEQVLNNLLTNASKYSDENSFTALRITTQEGDLKIVVSDNGIGMDGRELVNIFAPFYRIESEHARTVGGSGLGLAISKTIVELHDGTITAQSTVNEGTTFEIFLPLIDKPSRQLDSVG